MKSYRSVFFAIVTAVWSAYLCGACAQHIPESKTDFYTTMDFTALKPSSVESAYTIGVDALDFSLADKAKYAMEAAESMLKNDALFYSSPRGSLESVHRSVIQAIPSP